MDDRRDPWVPVCRTDEGVSFIVERDAKGKAFETRVCPRAATSDWAIEIVSMIGQQLHAKETAGVSIMPGPDLSRWPAWWYEAVMAVSARRNLRQHAEIEAMRRK